MEQQQFVNEPGAPPDTLSCVDDDGLNTLWQLAAEMKHRPGHMSLIRVSFGLLVAGLSGSLAAQNAAPAAAPGGPLPGTLRPALAQVGQTLSSLTIHRWKAPNEVKSAADQDVTSIQRDLSGTLAGLLQDADAAPGSVPAAFAVYRNVDALYDTLLRVVLTANLAAPDNEVSSLQTTLAGLEDARTTLGESILRNSQAQQTELMRIRSALANAAAAQKEPTKTTVVDDGPPTKPAAKKKPSTAKKPSSTSSKPANAGSGNPPQQ